MKDEILIRNTKLKLVRLNDSATVSLPKKTMRYQVVITVGEPVKGLIDWVTTEVIGKHLISTPNWDRSKGSWIMVKTNVKNVDLPNYDIEDLRVLSAFIQYTWYKGYIATCELLCHASGNEGIIDAFYRSYGPLSKAPLGIKFLALKRTNSDFSMAVARESQYPKCFERRRYSITRLLRDIVKYKAQVLLDSDLVGEYTRISKSGKQKSQIDWSTWSDVSSLVGNKERANISLRVVSKDGNWSSVNVIRDGVRNLDYIGIKSKELSKILKKRRLVEFTLIQKDEVLINLEKVPVVSRGDFKPVHSSSLARNFVEKRLADAAVKFYNQLISTPKGTRKTGTSSTSSPKSYHHYTAIALFTGVSAGLNMKSFLSGLPSDNPEERLKQWKDKQSKLEKELQNRTYDLIISKVARFDEKYKPVANSYNRGVYIDLLGTSVCVRWEFCTKSISL